MRLLVTTDNVGGVWTYSLDLARGLAALGVDVVLATMGAPLTDDQRAQAESVDLAALHESDFALEWMDDPWDAVDEGGEWLQEIAHRESADAIHLCSFSHAALGWSRPVVVVGHSCVSSWWRAVNGSDPPATWDEYRRRVAAGLRAADAVVAPTSAMLTELASDYGIDAGIVIPNGSATHEFDGPKDEVVLAAGRLWDRAKGLDVLDAAAAGLAWPVLAAGEGGVAAHVRPLGRLPAGELAQLRERAAIFAAPARYEPFGLAILEAARAGCALVLTDIPSLHELWSGAAAFVPAADARALHTQLAHLIDDGAARARLATAARIRSRRFTTHRMARSYLRLYRRLTAGASLREVAA